MAAVLMGLVTTSSAVSREASGDVAIAGMYDTALIAAQRGDAEVVVVTLAQALDPAIFDTLSPARGYEVARLYAEAARQTLDWRQAHRGFVLATGSPLAGDSDWLSRLHAAIMAGEAADAYATFLRLEKADRPILASLGDGHIDTLDQLLRKLPEPAARLALGRQMTLEGWQPVYAANDPSHLWLHYTEALLEAGDRAEASRAAGHIVNPMVIMAMHADRRFDDVVAANSALRDPKLAAEEYLAAAEAYMRENPRLLSGRIAVARALTILNRSGEALPLLEDASQAMATSSRSRPPFDDPELLETLETWRTSALIGVGRRDEAIGARVSQAACGCAPWASFSAARALLDGNRPVEALRWLREAPETGNPRLRMQTARVTACAASEVKDGALLARSLAYLADNQAVMPEAFAEALVCAGRTDQAAEVLARQVANPRTRLAVLSWLQAQTGRAPEAGFEGAMQSRWVAVVRDPVLSAQIAKVGRLNRFALAQFESVS